MARVPNGGVAAVGFQMRAVADRVTALEAAAPAPGVSFEHDAAVFVAKEGSDAASGLTKDTPKATLSAAVTAAEALLTAGATAVRVEVMDGASYTEASLLDVPSNVHVVAPGATFVGTVAIDAYGSFEIGDHYAGANGNRMANRTFTTDGPSFYRARISDGRGVAGTLNNTRNIDNSGGTGKNFFVEVGLMYVASNGEGIDGDTAGEAGHVHFRISDLYLAVGSAQGIRAGAASSNFIGYIDHILEVDSPLNTIGIHVLNADASVRVYCGEIVADTAYQISAGSLYLGCPRIVGAVSGEPAWLNGRVPVPASASAAGTPGEWAADATHLYTCTAVDTWVRVSHATWV